jgi:hypothetical protein
MGSRWRRENHFRYARIHLDLDSHDPYATTEDDPTPLVPNPAKKKAHRSSWPPCWKRCPRHRVSPWIINAATTP